MSRLDKRLARFRNPPTDMAFDEVKATLEAYGWTMRPGTRTSSSHVVFVKRGERSITVAIAGGRRVKRTYLVQIAERLGVDEG